MQREIHRHYGYNYHASCVYIRMKCGPLTPNQKPGSRTRLIKTGTFCFFCGFKPTNRTLRMQQRLKEWVITGK